MLNQQICTLLFPVRSSTHDNGFGHTAVPHLRLPHGPFPVRPLGLHLSPLPPPPSPPHGFGGWHHPPPSPQVENCAHIHGPGTVEVSTEAFPEGFFTLMPSLHGSRMNISYDPGTGEPPVLPPPPHPPTKAAPYHPPPPMRPPLHPGSFNVTVRLSRADSADPFDLYVCPVSLPRLGSAVGVHTLSEEGLVPLCPTVDRTTIAALQVSVLLPAYSPPAYMAFQGPRPHGLRSSWPPHHRRPRAGSRGIWRILTRWRSANQ